MTEPVVAERTGELFGYGRRRWPDIRQLLTDFVAVWGDLDGMYLAEPPPPEAPAYTHLWAWREQVYARVRLDPTTDQHVLGVLSVVGDPPPGGQPLGPVTVQVRPVRGWGNDPRVFNLRPELKEPDLERLVTLESAPVTFVGPSGGGRCDAG
jgi:hypothetical protein